MTTDALELIYQPGITVRHVLTAAYPVQIERIVELADATGASILDLDSYDKPGALLASSFLWSQTEEGFGYWAELAKQHGWRDALCNT